MESKPLKIAIVGGDNRQLLLHKHLIKSGYNSSHEGFNGACNYKNIFNSQIIILPTVATKDGVTLNAPMCNEIIELENLVNGLSLCEHIICGKLPKIYEQKIQNKNIKIFKYTDNDIFKNLNAVPTAEGAVAIAISETERTICGAKCLIIGNGCIGKSLTKILKGMGACLTVSARKELDFALLWSEGTKYVNTNLLNDLELRMFDVIFNTVPKRIISNKKMVELSKKQVVIDLASLPYGFDHESRNLYNCKLLLSSSIPAIYAPETSAIATERVIENYLKEVVNSGEN